VLEESGQKKKERIGIEDVQRGTSKDRETT
jgi:hypothetical protein